MSFERPSKGVLVFQCDVCFDTFEFDKANGDEIGDFRACWNTLRGEGWSMKNGRKSETASGYHTEHLCSDCSKTDRADRDNPFRR